MGFQPGEFVFLGGVEQGGLAQRMAKLLAMTWGMDLHPASRGAASGALLSTIAYYQGARTWVAGVGILPD